MRATVLVVEDNALNFELMGDLLSVNGCAVVLAKNGPEALEYLEKHTPNLILMDIGLPGMDGFATAEAIKANVATASIPIIGVSAHALEKHSQKASKAGFEDYITKPITVSNFLQRVNKFLGPTLQH